MSDQSPAEIMHFSDVLCIWAYVGQIRIDELKSKFGSQIALDYHFVPVFGAVEQKISAAWKERDGFAGYGRHVKEVAAKFEQVQVHPDIWTRNIPSSSASCHLFLKAVQILEQRDELPPNAATDSRSKSIFETLVWEFRRSFFEDLVNISELGAQTEISERLGLPTDKIKAQIENGEAFAAMMSDIEARERLQVAGSPTLIFNQGRQKIYGNVGYRIIEASVQELLNNPSDLASWC